MLAVYALPLIAEQRLHVKRSRLAANQHSIRSRLSLPLHLLGHVAINKCLDLREDMRSQTGRDAPIVKDSPGISMLATGEENASPKTLFQSTGQPAYEPTVVDTVRKMGAQFTSTSPMEK